MGHIGACHLHPYIMSILTSGLYTQSHRCSGPYSQYGVRTMKRYVIERDLPGVGGMNRAQFKDVATTSNDALAKLAGKAQWEHSISSTIRASNVGIDFGPTITGGYPFRGDARTCRGQMVRRFAGRLFHRAQPTQRPLSQGDRPNLPELASGGRGRSHRGAWYRSAHPTRLTSSCKGIPSSQFCMTKRAGCRPGRIVVAVRMNSKCGKSSDDQLIGISIRAVFSHE